MTLTRRLSACCWRPGWRPPALRAGARGPQRLEGLADRSRETHRPLASSRAAWQLQGYVEASATRIVAKSSDPKLGGDRRLDLHRLDFIVKGDRKAGGVGKPG